MSLESIPALDLSNVTNMPGIFGACPFNRIEAYGMKVSFDIVETSLGPTALNEVYTNLATVSGQTLNVSNNWGVSNDDRTIATNKGWTVIG